jgi:hypothetical protein
MVMKRLGLLAIFGAAFVLPAAPIHADAGSSADERKIERLETAYRKAERGAQTMGKKRLHHQNQMKRLDNVLDRLEAGQDVDPSEFDRLLR